MAQSRIRVPHYVNVDDAPPDPNDPGNSGVTLCYSTGRDAAYLRARRSDGSHVWIFIGGMF